MPIHDSQARCKSTGTVKYKKTFYCRYHLVWSITGTTTTDTGKLWGKTVCFPETYAWSERSMDADSGMKKKFN